MDLFDFNGDGEVSFFEELLGVGGIFMILSWIRDAERRKNQIEEADEDWE